MQKIKIITYTIGLLLLSAYGMFSSNCAAIAQVEPDTTLPSNSTVNQSSTTETITGGTQAGSNLFHSFKQFSIPTNWTAYFDNAPNVRNIFSRITGNSKSEINGTIRANGTANLFLINPNGIVFSPNAALNIGGSFLASTASSIHFADGNKFNAKTPGVTPLTISVPIGLQLGRDSGEIRIEGVGHELQLSPVDLIGTSPIVEPVSSSGLRVAPSQTLALIGGAVILNGGIVKAPAGHIEIGSAFDGTVGVSLDGGYSIFDYSNVSQFGDIKLFNKSLLGVSGSPSGYINMFGNNLSIRNGSTLLASNSGKSSSGQVQINAVNSLEMVGLENPTNFQYGIEPNRGIFSQNFAEGSGSNIIVTSPKISLKGFSNISSFNYGTGKGGEIIVNTQDLQISGLPPIPNFFLPSSISSATNSPGQAGSLVIVGDSLLLENGGLIISQSNSLGKSGDISINFVENIKVDGYSNANLVFNTSSGYVSSVLGTTASSFGNAGNVSINTPSLTISNGGRVNSTTAASGSAGDINVVADSIKLEGKIGVVQNLSQLFSSQITSSAEQTNPFLVSFFGIPPFLTGSSGDINLSSESILVQDNAFIAAINQGSGDAGEIQIDADSIRIFEQGNIATITNLGQGGNIFLNLRNLQLQDGSTISATAGQAAGSGDGGNISINTDLLVSSTGSAIQSDAFEGKGGNIQVDAKGIFFSPDSSLSASSELGIDGTIQVNNLIANPIIGLVDLPEALVDNSNLIAQGCPANLSPEASRFVVTGRGGLPENPNGVLGKDTTWIDSRLMPIENALSRSKINSKPAKSVTSPLIEATNWEISSQGKVTLVAATPKTSVNVPWNAPASCVEAS